MDQCAKCILQLGKFRRLHVRYGHYYNSMETMQYSKTTETHLLKSIGIIKQINKQKQGLPSWYWILYQYHLITMLVSSSVQYEMAYWLLVWYETLYQHETYMVWYMVNRVVQSNMAFHEQKFLQKTFLYSNLQTFFFA